MKTCKICKAEKDLDSFARHSEGRQGRRPECKVCQKKVRKSYPSGDTAKKALADRKRGLKKKYGMTLEDYDRMYANQNGRCSICKTPGDSGGKSGLAVDHCHVTGKVRALLCTRCNTTLGKCNDEPDLLETMATYLREHV